MKTKLIPALIMLLAGAITCIIGIVSRVDAAVFVRMLLIVLLVFYFFGCIVKMILDINFKEEVPADTDGEVASEDGIPGEDGDAERAAGEDGETGKQ